MSGIYSWRGRGPQEYVSYNIYFKTNYAKKKLIRNMMLMYLYFKLPFLEIWTDFHETSYTH
jgi:hypothetical protein